MTKIRRVLAALMLVLLAGALAQGASTAEQLRAVLQQWEELLNQGEAAAFAQLHTEDAFVRHATGDQDNGREEIQAWAQGFDEAALRLQFDRQSFVTGSLAENVMFIRGAWDATTDAGEPFLQGEMFAVLTQVDGTWRIAHIFSGSTPPPAEGG